MLMWRITCSADWKVIWRKQLQRYCHVQNQDPIFHQWLSYHDTPLLLSSPICSFFSIVISFSLTCQDERELNHWGNLIVKVFYDWSIKKNVFCWPIYDYVHTIWSAIVYLCPVKNVIILLLVASDCRGDSLKTGCNWRQDWHICTYI